jgi:hypothetical protein
MQKEAGHSSHGAVARIAFSIIRRSKHFQEVSTVAGIVLDVLDLEVYPLEGVLEGGHTFVFSRATCKTAFRFSGRWHPRWSIVEQPGQIGGGSNYGQTIAAHQGDGGGWFGVGLDQMDMEAVWIGLCSESGVSDTLLFQIGF